MTITPGVLAAAVAGVPEPREPDWRCGPSGLGSPAQVATQRFDELYRTHAADVLRYARGRVGEHAEDVVADTFAVAWQKLSDVPPGRERAWLLGTARKVSANYFRRRRTAMMNETYSLDEHPVATETGGLDTDVEGVAVRDELLRAIRILPPLDREALALVAWYDLTNQEAAGVMGCSVTSFAVRLHRARRRLRKELASASNRNGELFGPGSTFSKESQ